MDKHEHVPTEHTKLWQYFDFIWTFDAGFWLKMKTNTKNDFQILICKWWVDWLIDCLIRLGTCPRMLSNDIIDSLNLTEWQIQRMLMHSILNSKSTGMSSMPTNVQHSPHRVHCSSRHTGSWYIFPWYYYSRFISFAASHSCMNIYKITSLIRWLRRQKSQNL